MRPINFHEDSRGCLDEETNQSHRIQMRCTDMRRGNRFIVSNTDELVVVTMKAESRKKSTL